MVWIIAGVVVVAGLFALLDRWTDAPIQRRRVNTGTDRYRASMDWIRSSEQSIWDIRVGSGRLNDPTAKRLPINPPPENDSQSSA